MTIKEKVELLKRTFGAWFYVALTLDVAIIALIVYILFA
jgi:hypothetical protein